MSTGISTSSRIEGRAQLVPSTSALTVIDDVCVHLLGDLRAAVLSREDQTRSRSAPTLNQGGWRSGEIFSWAEPCVAELLFDLRRHVDVRIGSRASYLLGWAMINRLGSHHPRHYHQGSLLSGVYCVDPGGAPGAPGAPTIFESSEGEIAVPAAPGRLTMFPGHLWHRVPSCEGQAPRITIAFDVKR